MFFRYILKYWHLSKSEQKLIYLLQNDYIFLKFKTICRKERINKINSSYEKPLAKLKVISIRTYFNKLLVIKVVSE